MSIPRVCSIPDCGKKVKGYGWCEKHYNRWKSHGDPLFVKFIRAPDGGPQKFIENAIVYAGNDCLIWPYSNKNTRYPIVNRNGRSIAVHRIVCELAHGPSPSPKHEVAHGCGKGLIGCVAPNHLRWATRVENSSDKIIHGTFCCGEKHGNAKLTKKDVIEIRSLIGDRKTQEIANLYGISRQNVNDISSKRTWAWL